ncbi:glutaredoxin family protein [Actinomyces gaoshouyii]|uniref:glutaredoxin family protein n=1 Tax=Actinomyces gaoshouyii TaxID=1960083 RepID=UPI0009BE22E5|nr:glutaredoxin family protein [Actinomyces gaoshouyii]ARD42467.1 hypothetical protein B6G06_09065 [Actinomyces gaoshouyii]
MGRLVGPERGWGGMRIVVYSRPGCTACAQTMRALTRAGVGFTELSADEHRDRLTADLGATGLPVVLVLDGQEPVAQWQGLRPDLIRSWSRRWRAASAAGPEGRIA